MKGSILVSWGAPASRLVDRYRGLKPCKILMCSNNPKNLAWPILDNRVSFNSVRRLLKLLLCRVILNALFKIALCQCLNNVYFQVTVGKKCTWQFYELSVVLRKLCWSYVTNGKSSEMIVNPNYIVFHIHQHFLIESLLP